MADRDGFVRTNTQQDFIGPVGLELWRRPAPPGSKQPSQYRLVHVESATVLKEADRDTVWNWLKKKASEYHRAKGSRKGSGGAGSLLPPQLVELLVKAKQASAGAADSKGTGSGRAGNLVNPSEHLVEQKWQQLLASVARQAPPAMYFGCCFVNQGGGSMSGNVMAMPGGSRDLQQMLAGVMPSTQRVHHARGHTATTQDAGPSQHLKGFNDMAGATSSSVSRQAAKQQAGVLVDGQQANLPRQQLGAALTAAGGAMAASSASCGLQSQVAELQQRLQVADERHQQQLAALQAEMQRLQDVRDAALADADDTRRQVSTLQQQLELLEHHHQQAEQSAVAGLNDVAEHSLMAPDAPKADLDQLSSLTRDFKLQCNQNQELQQEIKVLKTVRDNQVSGMASMRLELAAATAAKEEMKAQLVTSRAEVEALRAQLDAVKR